MNLAKSKKSIHSIPALGSFLSFVTGLL